MVKKSIPVIAKDADISEIQKLIQDSELRQPIKAAYESVASIKQRVIMGQETFYVIKKQNKTIATIGVASQPATKNALVTILVTRKEYRKKGYAGILLDHALQELKKIGICKVSSMVNSEAINSQILLITRRFFPEGLISDAQGKGTKVIIYGLQL